MSEGRAYHLTPRDGTGLFLGLSATEVVIVGVGFLATVGLRVAAAPATIAAIPAVVAAIAARLRIGGRPLYRWLPLLAGWVAAPALGRRRWHGALPLLPAPDNSAAVLPPVLRGLDIAEVPSPAGTTIAVVRDRRTVRMTAVLPVHAERFAGADAPAQDSLIAGWSEVLASCATAASPVVQIGWSHQAGPATLEDHRAWLDEASAAGDDGDGVGDKRASYLALVEEVAMAAVEHDTVVWVTVSGRAIAGRGPLLDRAAASLPALVDDVRASLIDAGVDVGAPLTVPQLWGLLRRRSDPGTDGGQGAGQSLAVRMGLVARHAGPLAVDTSWSEVRIDGGWHRVYWVESWPRRPVGADWLAGFLSSLESATVTIAYRPLDPGRSQRRIGSQLVKLSAHRARKEDRARRVSEAEYRTEQAVHDLEAELASGHAEVLYLGLVCVAGTSPEDLDERCRDLEHAARGAQLGLRVLHGRQEVAWAASLPFGVTGPGFVDVAGL